jgi:hypothetical protein
MAVQLKCEDNPGKMKLNITVLLIGAFVVGLAHARVSIEWSRSGTD